ncbi:hypothetical protein B0H13DRAFT_1893879 [Mycena leptocephala]|nr:hypothetical protein B0H13DRAFT_1893879 [Mycena leptocephala]
MHPSVLYRAFLVTLSIFLAIMSPPSASPLSSLPQRRDTEPTTTLNAREAGRESCSVANADSAKTDALGVGTPSATQQAPLPPNQYALAHQARCEQERQAAATAAQAVPSRYHDA